MLSWLQNIVDFGSGDAFRHLSNACQFLRRAYTTSTIMALLMSWKVILFIVLLRWIGDLLSFKKYKYLIISYLWKFLLVGKLVFEQAETDTRAVDEGIRGKGYKIDRSNALAWALRACFAWYAYILLWLHFTIIRPDELLDLRWRA